MQTDIDRHSPVPSLSSSQPPDPPHFSLLTTFKGPYYKDYTKA
jgi:hypothetical protein